MLNNKLIFSVAYNMTGSSSAAQDVVQDINLKFLEKPIDVNIEDERNYVIRTTINHCINLMKRQQRLSYQGIWLPEPIQSSQDHNATQVNFEHENLLSYELAFLMEQLSPTERAVFVLREAFDFDHKEIADSIHISTENSRQLLKRAKQRVANAKHRSISNVESIVLAQRYVQHISEGNIAALIELFNDDISIMGDGGGKAPALKHAIFGREKVATFLVNVFGSSDVEPIIYFTEILSHPAISVYDKDKCVLVQVLSVNGDRISQIFSVLNPDKLSEFRK